MVEESQNEHDSIDPSKLKRGDRIQRTKNHINKQLKIVKTNGVGSKYLKQPHRLAKHSAMDCGRSECNVCGNPRKIFEAKTIQELKFEQTEKWDDYESKVDKLLGT